MKRPYPRQAALQVALALSLVLAWLNVLLTAKWAGLPGALHGWRLPWYAAALLVTTVLAIAGWRSIGSPSRLGRRPSALLLAAGAFSLAGWYLARMPPSQWTQIPFKDDWTELFQQAVNGVALLRRGEIVGWNWGFLGGYPTSTDIAQNLGVLALVPMSGLGEALGYHVLHAVMLLWLPLFVWWDLRQDDRDAALLSAALVALCAAGYSVTIANSGDTNSLAGVFSATIALAGSRAARLGRPWGGPVLLLGLVLGLYTHVAFFVYAVIFLALEAAYFRDGRALGRLVLAAAVAGVAALPVHWESLRYASYVSFNNTVYNPGAPLDWARFLRLVYYNVEMLAFPHRWFNDYRSLANVWLPILVVAAFVLPRSRVGFYAWATVLAQALLRFNTPEAGAVFDRIQHMLPVIEGPALAGIVLYLLGTRALALSAACTMALYIATSWAPIRHVPDLRAWDPPLMDRIAASDGNMVLVELSPHRDMNSDTNRRTPTTPFDVHFEGLLPRLAGQRFYSQMIDGWVWNIWRGQVVAAGTFAGRPIDETPPGAFAAEMHKWGVRHLFVWTDESRSYLASSGRFVERWRGGRWSHFEIVDPDVRSVVTSAGSGRLANLDALGGDVQLEAVAAGEPIVVRMNYYPAWRARAGTRDVPLYASDGQLAFRAPSSGTYTVHLAYPRYRALIVLALVAFVGGGILLWRW